MNYFTWLLVSAGLPVLGLSTPSPAPAPAPSSAPAHLVSSMVSRGPASAPVANEAQAMATIQTYLASQSSAAPSSATTAPAAPLPTSSPSPATAANNSPTTSPSNSAQGLAATMIAWINQARTAQDLPPYAVNPTLMTLAQERAQALASGPFTHDLPGLGWPIQMETAAGIQAQAMGAENIAVAPNLETAFSLLMASPEHRANILSPYETQIGVGVAPDGNGVAISELFIGPNL